MWNSEDGFIVEEQHKEEIPFEDWIVNTVEQLKNLQYTSYTFEELTPKTKNLEAYNKLLEILKKHTNMDIENNVKRIYHCIAENNNYKYEIAFYIVISKNWNE